MNKETVLLDSLPSNVQMNKKKFQKMLFIMNALDNGWGIKKTNDLYIFTKKHEGKREVFQENYLETFFRENLTDYTVI
jgi:hypothetical protein